jgi:hypothetical protein
MLSYRGIDDSLLKKLKGVFGENDLHIGREGDLPPHFYEQMKLRESGFEPTIFIGIGGTGQNAIRKLKSRMSELGLLRAPIFGFLTLDTTIPDAIKDAGNEIPIDSSEFISLQVNMPTAYIDEARQYRQGRTSRQPELGEWLPDSFTAAAIMSGANARRSVGRFSLFVNAERAGQEIDRMVKRVNNVNNARIMNELGLKFNQDSPVRVYIIGSLCGGTGSGIFIDLAYLLRKMLALSSHAKTIVSGVLLTNYPGATDVHRANAYAALMELNYFSHIDSQEGAGGKFQTKYKGIVGTVTSNNMPPFNACYLVGTQTSTGNWVNSIDQICDMIAEWLFVVSCTEAGKKYGDGLDNIISNFQFGIENPECFSGFGIGCLAWPKDWIARKWGARLGADLLAQLTMRDDSTIERSLLEGEGISAQFSTKAVNSFNPISNADKEIRKWLTQNVSGSNVFNANDTKEIVHRKMEKLEQDKSQAFSDYCQRIIANAQLECDALRELIGSRATAIYGDSNNGGYVQARSLYNFMRSDLAVLLRNLTSDIESNDNEYERSKNALNSSKDQVVSEKTSLISLLKTKFDPVSTGEGFKSKLFKILDLQARRDVRKAVHEELVKIIDEIDKVENDLMTVSNSIENARAILERKWVSEQLDNVPFYCTYLDDSDYINELYQKEIGNMAEEKAKFLNSLSMISRFAQLTDGEIVAAMKAYTYHRLDRIINYLVSEAIKALAEKQGIQPVSYVEKLIKDTAIAWNYYKARQREEIEELQVLAAGNSDSAKALLNQISESGSKTYICTVGLSDKIWLIKTGHKVSIESLTDVDDCFASFDQAVTDSQIQYLFTHRRFPGNFLKTLRPDHVIKALSAARFFVKALALNVITKDSLNQYKIVLSSNRVIELGQGRLNAYNSFLGNASLLDEVYSELEILDQRLSPKEKLERFKQFEEEITQLLNQYGTPEYKEIKEHLDGEYHELRKLIKEENDRLI